MCQRIGLPPISTIGLGRTAVSSLSRVPRPPARITAFMWASVSRKPDPRLTAVTLPRDLRDWIALLEREGELVRVTAEVDPDLEITEIVDRVVKAGGPALLFENPKGASIRC